MPQSPALRLTCKRLHDSYRLRGHISRLRPTRYYVSQMARRTVPGRWFVE